MSGIESNNNKDNFKHDFLSLLHFDYLFEGPETYLVTQNGSYP